MSTMYPSIIIKDLVFHWENAVLFENIHFTLPSGQWTCLLGSSGIGKSTLLHCIAGLIPFSKGSIYADDGKPLQHRISYMSQSDLLMPWLNALENTLIGFELRETPRNTKKEMREKAKHLFEQLQLPQAISLYPNELSGGMRQRVALIRTLLEDRPIVLMDEPFSALDAVTRAHLQNLSLQLLKNKTILFVTHDPMEALRLSDKIIMLSGQPAQLSEPMDLRLLSSRDPFSPEISRYYIDILHYLSTGKISHEN